MKMEKIIFFFGRLRDGAWVGLLNFSPASRCSALAEERARWRWVGFMCMKLELLNYDSTRQSPPINMRELGEFS